MNDFENNLFVRLHLACSRKRRGFKGSVKKLSERPPSYTTCFSLVSEIADSHNSESSKIEDAALEITSLSTENKVLFYLEVFSTFKKRGFISDDSTGLLLDQLRDAIAGAREGGEVSYRNVGGDPLLYWKTVSTALSILPHEVAIRVVDPELHAALVSDGRIADGSIPTLHEYLSQKAPELASLIGVPESALQDDDVRQAFSVVFPPPQHKEKSFRAKIEAERGQGQEAHKLPLPTAAPERWKGRADKSETPHAFIERVYATWLPDGEGEQIDRGTLSRLDPGLYKQLRIAEAKGYEEASEALQIAPGQGKKGRTTEQEKADYRAGKIPASPRDRMRIESAVRRERSQAKQR